MTQPDRQAHIEAALKHVDHALGTGHIAVGAAKGVLFSIAETLGVMVGDPDLPAHLRSGYEGLLETARELQAKLERHDPPAH